MLLNLKNYITKKKEIRPCYLYVFSTQEPYTSNMDYYHSHTIRKTKR